MFIKTYLFRKNKWNPNQKHPSCKKVAAKTWKRLWWKDVKSKRGGQGLCRNAVNYIKNFDNDDPGHKTLWHLGVLFVPVVVIMEELVLHQDCVIALIAGVEICATYVRMHNIYYFKQLRDFIDSSHRIPLFWNIMGT